jgi:hypothetical protein
MTFLKAKDPDDLLMLDKKSIEDSLMEFIQWQKDGGVGAGLIRVRMAAIKKFYKRNCVSLDWDLILETIGKPKKLKKDRAYSPLASDQRQRGRSSPYAPSSSPLSIHHPATLAAFDVRRPYSAPAYL